MKDVTVILEQFRRNNRGFASVPDGSLTLYGTCYGLLTSSYINYNISHEGMIDFILAQQDANSGLFKGPEFSEEFFEGANHDAEHILLHSTCTVLPVLQQYGVKPFFPIHFAHKFCDKKYLTQWLNNRNWNNAWLEGNNLLFVGQLLVYLRDEEKQPEAQTALDLWFAWLDKEVDSKTGLWGTNGFCNHFNAMCGGYHQLLIYYYENHPISYHKELVDTVLTLQHADGGFSPSGGGGACEDVDAVDILVNLYKLYNYRRPAIRISLRKCLNHILSLQNEDGGFPYKRNTHQSHMGIPATVAEPNVSTMFATWFRVHTLALISEILTDDPLLKEISFNFSKAISMGWHRKWKKTDHPISKMERFLEVPTVLRQDIYNKAKRLKVSSKNKIKRLIV